jgi:hypothetical protein
MKFLITLVCILLYSLYSFSQGCSDAGACSIETFDFKAHSSVTDQKVSANLNQTFALGEKFIFISQTTIGLQYRLVSSTRFELISPFIFTYGNLGQTSGIGDIMISASQDLFQQKDFQLTATLGGRLRTNHANFSFNDNPLPMAYQTSLGTNDIIIGMQYSRMKWNVYMAYQHPFGSNKNEYLVPEEETDPNKQYFESAYLDRGDDLYLRTQYNLILKSDDSFLFNFMGIYRIQQSEILKNDESILLKGSSGLTLNIGATFKKQLTKNRELNFLLAFPLVDRDYRADGLTRNIIFGISIRNL